MSLKNIQTAVILALVGVIGYQRYSMTPKGNPDVTLTSQETLSDGSVRSSSVKTDISSVEDSISKSGMDLSAIKKDNAKTGYKHRAHLQNTFNTEGTTTQAKSNNTEVVTSELHGTQIKSSADINETYGTDVVKIGTVSFISPSEVPWEIRLFPKSLSMNTVISEDEDGNLLTHNKLSLTVNGVETTLPIGVSHLLLAPKPSRWMFHTGYHLNAIFSTRSEFLVGVSAYGISYGSDKKAPDWTLLNLGAATNSSFDLSLIISPVRWRLGSAFKYMPNTYVGMDLILGKNLDTDLGATLSVKF